MRTFFKTIIVFILTWEAKRVLKTWRPFIVLVSGSVGKTTTKDAVYHVLKESIAARKSEKSFNSEIGVPLTILGLENAWSSPLAWLKNIWRGSRVPCAASYPKLLVLEVGSDHPGDIARLMEWLTPDIAIVTCLPHVPVHVENFDSPESIRREDALVVLALRQDGVYVANADDEHAYLLTDETDKRHVRSITYGFGRHAKLRGSSPMVRYAKNEGVDAPVGMQFDVTWEGETLPVYLNGVLGVQSCTAALAALAVGIARGLSFFRMTEALLHLETPPGRMRVIEGKNGSTIIDDSYNSSPVALSAALALLREVTGKRKIAMLGDMLELGPYSEEEHWKAGRLAGAFVDELITVGKRARWIAEAAKSSGLPQGCIHEFATSDEAGAFMLSVLERGDIILAKGSQGSGENMIRMERAVKMLMAHPDEAKTMLVRQEDEWTKR